LVGRLSIDGFLREEQSNDWEQGQLHDFCTMQTGRVGVRKEREKDGERGEGEGNKKKVNG
jgi:hypothetical protein